MSPKNNADPYVFEIGDPVQYDGKSWRVAGRQRFDCDEVRWSYLIEDPDGWSHAVPGHDLQPVSEQEYQAVVEVDTAFDAMTDQFALPRVFTGQVGSTKVSIVESVLPGATPADDPVRGRPWIVLTGEFTLYPARIDSSGSPLPGRAVGGTVITVSTTSAADALDRARRVLTAKAR